MYIRRIKMELQGVNLCCWSRVKLRDYNTGAGAGVFLLLISRLARRRDVRLSYTAGRDRRLLIKSLRRLQR